MAVITTRISGTSSQNNYGYYANVLVWDNIHYEVINGVNTATFRVMVNTYVVNNGTRFNSYGWEAGTGITNVGDLFTNDLSLNSTTVDKYGGELFIASHTFFVPITMSTIGVYGHLSKSGGYSVYDPGYCSFGGYVSMPKVQSTWSKSLLSIQNIENAFTLPINKYVNDYYNVVDITNANGTQIIKTINNANDGDSVTLTSSELNTIYTMDNNANQLPLVFYMNLKTYTDSSKTTQIGTAQSLKCEAYIVNGEPTATYTIVEQDEKVISLLGASSNKIIKNASDLLFTITPTALKGATISNVKINDVNATLSSGNYVLNITNLTTGTFNIVITDSRGLTKTYTATKTLLDYIACQINNWSIQRETQVSSNLILNANVNVWNSTIDGNTNTIVVNYSIDNENWTTIPSSSYTITDNVLKITNLNLSNIVVYTSTATFYLDISDILSETKENYQIAKGIETYSWGENDLQVNGEIYVADEEGNNLISLTHCYSTNEIRIGYWIDNKPIYRKVIHISSLPNNYYTDVSHNISNVDEIVGIKGIMRTLSNHITTPLNMSGTSLLYGENTVCVRADRTKIQIGTTTDYSANEAYITLDYTKTTD